MNRGLQGLRPRRCAGRAKPLAGKLLIALAAAGLLLAAGGFWPEARHAVGSAARSRAATQREGPATSAATAALTRSGPEARGAARAGEGFGAEPSRALVRSVLAAAIAEHLPRLALSDVELDQLADAVLRLRSAQRDLRSLRVAAENAERLRALRADVALAVSDFAYVAGMSPGEFSERVQPGFGLDPPPDPGEAPDAIVFERLATPNP
jgi:hypothetical protein